MDLLCWPGTWLCGVDGCRGRWVVVEADINSKVGAMLNMRRAVSIQSFSRLK
jgi:predicted RNase H-like nuclease